MIKQPSNKPASLRPKRPSSTPELGFRIGRVLALFDSRKKAAEAARVSTDQLLKWERGESKPSFNAIAALCATVGVSLDWVASGEGPKFGTDPVPTTAAQTGGQGLSAQDKELLMACFEAVEWIAHRTAPDVPGKLKASLALEMFEREKAGLGITHQDAKETEAAIRDKMML